MKKYLIFGLITIFNYNFPDYLSLNFLKCFTFLFLQVILLFLFLGIRNDREIEFRRVCWQNYALYVRNTFLEERLKSLRGVLETVGEEFNRKVSSYQRSIDRCGFPFCKEMIKGENICKTHSKYKTEECAICYESFGEDYYPLNCGHYIHQECLAKDNSKKCPICRTQI